jgi:hypothetical protein
MGGTAHLPLARRQQQTAKATAAYPPLAQRSVNGGRHFAERYRFLPPEERQRIAIRCVVGRHLWWARKNGFPDPIIHIYEPELGPDGKLKAKSGTMRRMTDAEIEAL